MVAPCGFFAWLLQSPSQQDRMSSPRPALHPGRRDVCTVLVTTYWRLAETVRWGSSQSATRSSFPAWSTCFSSSFSPVFFHSSLYFSMLIPFYMFQGVLYLSACAERLRRLQSPSSTEDQGGMLHRMETSSTVGAKQLPLSRSVCRQRSFAFLGL